MGIRAHIWISHQIPTFQVCTELYYQIWSFRQVTSWCLTHFTTQIWHPDTDISGLHLTLLPNLIISISYILVPRHLYHSNLTSRYWHFRFALHFTTKSDHSDKLHLDASPTLPPTSDIQIPTFQVCTGVYYQIWSFHMCTVLPPKND
jgi:hypothetical protein